MQSGGVFLLVGLGLLLAVVLPQALSRFAISAPVVLVGAGLAIGFSPLPDLLAFTEPSAEAVLRVTEVTVIVALMGVGLALDRPLHLRSLTSWRRWSSAWRLLAVTMPLTIGGVALLGWWAAGLGPAAALALGAVLAPTDPVLASDVQVAGPSAIDLSDGSPEGTDGPVEDPDEPDDLRFALTAEAGLNDGLAFPFVHLALLVAAAGGLAAADVATWVGWYLVGKVVIGVAVGILVGRFLGRFAFRSRRPSFRLAEQGEPLLALAALLTAYGLAEVVAGYGFLAVFACAMTVRAHERSHRYHVEMHAVVERLERLLTLVVLLGLGVACTRGLLDHLDAAGVLVGVALVLVIRPVTGLVALLVRRRGPDHVGGLTVREAAAAALFGVRGIGSLFYLAYVATHVDLPEQDWLWSTVAFTIVLSVVVHGVAATPVLQRLERLRAG